MKIKIKKSKYGYYYTSPLPNKNYLKNYYKEKYFKNNISYKNTLLKSEIDYLNCISEIKIFVLKKFLRNLKKKILLTLELDKEISYFMLKNILIII